MLVGFRKNYAKFPTTFLKNKFLIDPRRADSHEGFLGFRWKLQAIFASVHLWQLKPDQLKNPISRPTRQMKPDYLMSSKK